MISWYFGMVFFVARFNQKIGKIFSFVILAPAACAVLLPVYSAIAKNAVNIIPSVIMNDI
jgi:hypothetical protein